MTACRIAFRTMLVVLVGLFSSRAAWAGTGVPPLTTERVASGLFSPLFVTHAPGDFDRVFIVEQRVGSNGRIRILDLTTTPPTLLATPFLSVPGVAFGAEQGLLGLTFHPDYANNGFFYVNFTAGGSGTTNIRRYTVSADPNIADPNSAFTIMTFAQPFENHNGGWIEFGPNDGFLYISTGDGGAANDPFSNGQTTVNTRLGKLLRIDVDGDDFPADPGRNYAIPPDNPFVGATGDDEIWAYGLRNPWRCAFDRANGDLYIADVGQNAVEEIDFQRFDSRGKENYGWRCMEGSSCTGLSGCTCNSPALKNPIHDYTHAGGNCSVTGGVVYRGCAIPGLQGTYFFADFCSSEIWSFRFDGLNLTEFTTRTAELDPPGILAIAGISSFGEDAAGEAYICDLFGGEVFRIIPATPLSDADINGDGTVDSVDAGLLVQALLDNPPKGDCLALRVDVNGDGINDGSDIVAWIGAL